MEQNDPKNLYSKTDLQAMLLAEESKLSAKTGRRIINYAKSAGIKRIGIAYCFELRREAEVLRKRLSEHFETYSVNCLTGKIQLSEILGKNTKGFSCNPVGQALYLSENRTELNVAFGLCMGHDILFSQKSHAPVTTLVVKDRQHKHNPYQEFEN
jgi:uncharacterized metal-binding protein